jgi:hypothetical protein
MKHTLWDQKHSARDELSQGALLALFDPSGSLDKPELLSVLGSVAKTSEIPMGKLRPQDEFDEIFRPGTTWNLFRGLRMAFKTWDLGADLEEALAERRKKNGLPIPKKPIVTLEEYVAVWFGTQSKAA